MRCTIPQKSMAHPIPIVKGALSVKKQKDMLFRFFTLLVTPY